MEKNNACKCPECGSNAITTSEEQVEETHIERELECYECGIEFSQIFNYSHAVILSGVNDNTVIHAGEPCAYDAQDNGDTPQVYFNDLSAQDAFNAINSAFSSIPQSHAPDVWPLAALFHNELNVCLPDGSMIDGYPDVVSAAVTKWFVDHGYQAAMFTATSVYA